MGKIKLDVVGEIKENSVIFIKTKRKAQNGEIGERLQKLRKELPKGVLFLLLEKGDSMNILDEKQMNENGWYR